MVKRSAPRKRSNGEGSVYHNNRGTWTAQFSLPTGKRVSKTFKTQRLAAQWLRQQKHELDIGTYIEPSTLCLGDWLTTFVDVYKKKSVTEKTLESYAYSRARLPQDLLDRSISDIKPADIQEALNAIQGERRTIEITRTFLLMAFEQAVLESLIHKNPVKPTKLPPEKHERKAKALTKVEEEALIQILTAPVRVSANGTVDKFDLASQTIRDALFFCLKTGSSREEACSMRWEDIGELIHIRGTKNKHRNRYVPSPEDLTLMLERRKQSSNSDYVFATRAGKKIDGTNLYRWMKSNSNHTVHDLRHTYFANRLQTLTRFLT
ncbi:MAG: hypothetical protein EOM08_07215 [Clostridia bacterium]|nr:hypothetical protein [Clostridia bacterium]